ncbi:MAG: hypothetical protein K1W16_04670 [Lachnospiraceae bacterium]
MKLEQEQKALSELNQICKKLIDEIKVWEKLQAELCAAQEEYQKAVEEKEQAGIDYREIERRFLSVQAGLPARELKEGMACPVCGSIHHNHLAEIPKEAPTKETVEKKKELFTEAEKKAERFSVTAGHLNARFLEQQQNIYKLEQSIFDSENKETEQHLWNLKSVDELQTDIYHIKTERGLDTFEEMLAGKSIDSCVVPSKNYKGSVDKEADPVCIIKEKIIQRQQKFIIRAEELTLQLKNVENEQKRKAELDRLIRKGDVAQVTLNALLQKENRAFAAAQGKLDEKCHQWEQMLSAMQLSDILNHDKFIKEYQTISVSQQQLEDIFNREEKAIADYLR